MRTQNVGYGRLKGPFPEVEKKFKFMKVSKNDFSL
jgi:hypothetical protein